VKSSVQKMEGHCLFDVSFLRALPISCVKYIELRANPDILLAEQVSINFNPHILRIR
jgi:hypothetical protein